MTSLEIVPLTGLPLIGAGDDLTELIASAFRRNGVGPRAADVLVVAQKIVSKAEGRLVDLATIEPSARAVALAADVDEVNKHFARIEQIKRFRILDNDLTQEGGELTPTMKVKRNVVYGKYADFFSEIYQEP